jgi:hypothetical protein
MNVAAPLWGQGLSIAKVIEEDNPTSSSLCFAGRIAVASCDMTGQRGRGIPVRESTSCGHAVAAPKLGNEHLLPPPAELICGSPVTLRGLRLDGAC